MIVFKKLQYRNILATGNSPIEIVLDSHHKTLFTGENGHGKSTVLSALSFGLFGKDIRGINKPSMVNSINKKNMLVEVWFETDGKEYHIKRGFRPSVFEIYLDGTLLNQTASARDYQKYIEENVLKLNFNSFKQIVILSAKNFVPFMVLPAHARREIIEDLLDLSVFTRMNIILKDKIQISRDRLQEIENSVMVENQKKKILEEHLKKIEKESLIKRDELLKKIKQTQGENDKKQEDVEILSKKALVLQEKQRKLLEIEKKRLEFDSHLRSSTKKTNEVEKEIFFYENNSTCPTCHQDITEEFKQKIRNRSAEELKKHEQLRAKLELQLAKIEKALALNTSINNELNRTNYQISKLQGDVHSNQKYIAMLETEIEKHQTEDKEKNSLVSKIEGLNQIIAGLNKQKEEIINDREVQLYALSLLKDTGIKTKIIKTYVPMMNKLINGYLSSMDFYINFELDENFNEVIKSRHRDEFSYANFSDGEKQRIDLAILFTWRQIAKIKNSMSVNILFLDEIGDSSLDQEGVDDLIKILYTLKDTNIFMISHKTQMVEKFDRIIKFEKINNFTTVSEGD